MKRNWTGLILLLAAALSLVISGCSRSPAEKEARYLQRGKGFLAKNDTARALLEFQNAARAMPKDAEPVYQLALAYLGLKDPARAVAALRKAVELNPKHSLARLKLAELMAATDSKSMVEEARKSLEGLLGETPENADVLNALAWTEARLGDVEDAQRHIEDALAKAPSHLRSSALLAQLKLKQGDAAGAEQALKKAVEVAPQSADAALALAGFYLAQTREQEGEAEIRRSLQLRPKNAPALLTLAAIEMKQGRIDAAEATYREVSAIPDPRYRGVHAAFLLRQGKRDAAIAELETLVKQDSKDRETRSRLVEAYMASGRSADAERVLAAALKQHGNDTDALFQQSALFLSSGKYAEAKSGLLKVLHAKPDSALARYALSRAEGGLGLFAEQRDQLNEALRLQPALLPARVELSRIYIAAGQATAAVDLMNQTPERQRGLLEARSGRIRALLAAGNQPDARKEIDQALETSRAPEFLLAEAALNVTQKNYKRARASLDEVLKSSPERFEAWRGLLQIAAAEGQLPKATEQLRTAVAQHPKSAGLQYLFGQALLAQGKRQDASAALSAASAADSRFVAADLMLAEIEKENGALDNARRRLAGALAKSANYVPAMLMLGDVELASGNRPGAVVQYRAAVEHDGRNVVALNNLAYVLARDDPDSALAYAQKAVEVSPDSPAVLDTIGWVYYRKGLYQMAVTNLRNAVAKGGTPLHKYHLAMAYLKVGDREEGQKLIQAAVQADPELPKKEVDW